MKTKIIDETFDEKSGLTTVTLQNKYGHFTGIARCHPDDEYSMFQGERIAVTKANIKFLEFRIKQTKIMIKSIYDFVGDYKWHFITNPIILDDPLFDHAALKIINYKKDIENYKTSIEILKNSIKLMDEERQKVLQRSKKNK